MKCACDCHDLRAQLARQTDALKLAEAALVLCSEALALHDPCAKNDCCGRALGALAAVRAALKETK